MVDSLVNSNHRSFSWGSQAGTRAYPIVIYAGGGEEFSSTLYRLVCGRDGGVELRVCLLLLLFLLLLGSALLPVIHDDHCSWPVFSFLHTQTSTFSLLYALYYAGYQLLCHSGR